MKWLGLGLIFRVLKGRLSLKSLLLWWIIPFFAVSTVAVGLISYAIAERQIVDNAYVGIQDTVVQTKNYLDNRLNDVFEQFVAIEDNANLLSIRGDLSQPGQSYNMHDYIDLSRYLDKVFLSYHSLLDSIFIDCNNGQFRMYKTENMVSRVAYDFPAWREQYPEGGYRWLGFHDDEIFANTNTDEPVASLFHLTGDANSKLNGLVCFNFREEFFKNIMTTPQISPNGYLLVVGTEDEAVFKAAPTQFQLPKTEFSRLRQQTEPKGNFGYLNSAGERLLVVYDTLRLTHWKLAAVLPESELLEKASLIKYLILILIVVFAFLGVILSVVIVRGLSLPVETLAGRINQVYAGNTAVPFDVSGFKEIEVLNHGIEALVQRGDQLLANIRVEQQQKRQAELAVLQAQINPHFLYNTLYSIHQLCDLGESKAAANMIAALSNFFRIGLSKGQSLISVNEEIEHVRNYLVIQTMKYQADFDYTIQVAADLGILPIVKLTLQPIVENAIYHGVKQKRAFGHIAISATSFGSEVQLEVTDDGAGIPAATLERIQRSLDQDRRVPDGEVFGLCNVHDRLRLQFGETYGLRLFSHEGQGTTVVVRIPGSIQ